MSLPYVSFRGWSYAICWPALFCSHRSLFDGNRGNEEGDSSALNRPRQLAGCVECRYRYCMARPREREGRILSREEDRGTGVVATIAVGGIFCARPIRGKQLGDVGPYRDDLYDRVQVAFCLFCKTARGSLCLGLRCFGPALRFLIEGTGSSQRHRRLFFTLRRTLLFSKK